MPKFLPRITFKWINLKDFDSIKDNNNSSTGCVSEVDLEYPKELNNLYNGYPLAPNNIEI